MSTWLSDPQVVMSGIGGVAIGLLFPIAHAWWRRRKERRGEFYAMHSEMRQTHDNIRSLLRDDIQIKAPLYRLPLTMFTIAIPKLIGEGNLSHNEIGALLEYMTRADELNRGLDRAGQAHAAVKDDEKWLDEEFGRNRQKGRTLLDERLDRLECLSVFDAAQAALFRLEEHHSFWQCWN